jgi:16S rRNA U1498 N3-methylase RsmE
MSPLSLPDAAGGRRSVDLPERVAHHASKVLRLRSGDALTLFTAPAANIARE